MIARFDNTHRLPTLRIDSEDPVVHGQEDEQSVAYLSITSWMETAFGEPVPRNVFVGVTMEELESIRAVIDSIITITKEKQ